MSSAQSTLLSTVMRTPPLTLCSSFARGDGKSMLNISAFTLKLFHTAKVIFFKTISLSNSFWLEESQLITV